MGMVTCRDCGAEVSDRATDCPRCGGPMAPHPAQQAPSENKLLTTIKWGAGIFTTAWLLSLCTDSGSSKPAPGASAPRANTFSQVEALNLCREAFKRIAKDPEKANIPSVANHGDSREYYFAWGAETSMIRMRNGMGLEVAVSGSCIVDAATRKITSLTMNRETII